MTPPTSGNGSRGRGKTHDRVGGGIAGGDRDRTRASYTARRPLAHRFSTSMPKRRGGMKNDGYTVKPATRDAAATGIAQPEMMRQRLKIIVSALVIVMLVLMIRLAWVQVVWGPGLSEQAVAQRSHVYVEPARRGNITDKEGQRLAYTMQARSLTVSPTRLRDELRQQQEQELTQSGELEGKSAEETEKLLDKKVDGKLDEMAKGIPAKLKSAGTKTDSVNSKQIRDKLDADTQYEVLVRNVDPDVAADIAKDYHGLAADHQDIRQYPNGAIAENIIGKVSMDGQGQFGFESAGDDKLTGVDGRSTEDVSADGQVIPGTLRDDKSAKDGHDVKLTLDLDLQTYVQQKLEKAKENSHAKAAEAVVLDVATGEVLAMANTGTIDPNKDIDSQLEDDKNFENKSVSYPYEPGSVAKVITAAAALEENVTTPDEVHQVPGSIDMAGVTVNDAWPHGVVPFTTTGIFGKSSNVGTLMLADKLGQKKYKEYLDKFGIGDATGIELPNESTGLVPPQKKWAEGTFANLPIGQGMSWTTLQMASVYQALANEGERIEPRIIDEVSGEDGEDNHNEPKRTQVVSPETARTTVDMLRAVFQEDPTGAQNGTAANARLDSYQLSGKTGTAQKVDKETGGYSNSRYWITFAGVAPADNPRFAVAIMLDEPTSGVKDDGSGGQSAAPVFTDIAKWLLNRDNIPTSPEAPRLTLQAG